MDSSAALVVFIIAVSSALFFSFMCSIFESVLLSVSRGHVEAMAKQGSRAGRILRRWKRSDIEVPVAAILILNTIAHTVGSTMAGSSYEGAFGEGSLAYFSIVFTIAILLFTEIIPKTVGVAFANKLSGPVTLAVQALVYVLWPVLQITSWISRKLTGEHKRPVTSIEEIRLLAAIGSHEGDVGPRFAAFIDGIASLAELTVHDVMVPRVHIKYLSAEKSFADNLEVVRGSGHSRFPFTPTSDLDDVTGIVLAKELLFFDHDSEENDEPDWEAMQSPLLVVPETKHLDQVLRLFQAERKHLAVVVDEYGGTQGVVTLEDVLEEIVGEIEDETDRVERHIIKLSDGRYRCHGLAETRKLFKVLGIEQKVESVTMGGFVADVLGHVPKIGDIAEWENLRIEVTKASRRRAEQLVVRVVPKVVEEETTG
jgi:CBS domain containing-hemolysin-like protein